MERMRGNFLISHTVGGNFAALPEEHKAVSAVPIFHDIQPFVDFPAESFRAQIAAQKNRLIARPSSASAL